MSIRNSSETRREYSEPAKEHVIVGLRERTVLAPTRDTKRIEMPGKRSKKWG